MKASHHLGSLDTVRPEEVGQLVMTEGTTGEKC